MRSIAGNSGDRPEEERRPAFRSAPEPDLPRFTLPAAGGLRSGSIDPALLDGLGSESNAILREAFTPTRPKQKAGALFVGRAPTLRRIIAAIEEERAHVILFGDRGRGKTSVANVVEQIAGQAGYLAIKATCSSEMGFADTFRHILRRAPASYHRSGANNPFGSSGGASSLADRLPPGDFGIGDLMDVLAGIQGSHLLVILDEYDRITDEDFRNRLAELLKNLSDGAVAATLFIIGVAENLDQLLGKHPSIQRALVPVHLPPMADADVRRLLTSAADSAGLRFTDGVADQIAAYARGLPYYAQLLGLHAARSAVSRRSGVVEPGDLAYALQRCLQEADPGLAHDYARAIGANPQSSRVADLVAAARSRTDEYGLFDPAGVDGASGPLPAEHLERLVREEAGAVLAAIPDAGRVRYRFRNPMMPQYVLMRHAVDRGVS